MEKKASLKAHHWIFMVVGIVILMGIFLVLFLNSKSPNTIVNYNPNQNPNSNPIGLEQSVWGTDANVTLIDYEPNFLFDSNNPIKYFLGAINITDGARIVNYSLYHNESGSFILNQTVEASGTITNTTEGMDGGATYTSVTDTAWRAQGFNLSSNSILGTVNFTILRVGTPGTCWLSLFDSYPDAGTILTTKSFNGNALDTGYTNLSIDITDTPITANQEYWLTLNCTTSEARVQVKDPGTYLPGFIAFSSDSGSSWSNATTQDMAFRLGLTTGLNNTIANMTANITKGIIWNIYACDSDGACAFDTTGNHTLEPKITLNSQNYSASTFETQSETFAINLTANSSLTAVNLIFNGTSYAATQNGLNWSKTFDIPTGISTKNFYWNMVYAGTSYNSSANSVTIAGTNLSLCGGAGGSVPYLNYTFKDETDLSALNATLNLEWAYYLGSGTVNKTLSFLNASENSKYAFCATPPSKSLNVYGYSQYASTGYPQRRFDFDSLFTNTTTNQTLYLLSTANGIYAQFQISNSVTGNAVSGVSVDVSRTISGVSTTVATDKSDDSGLVIFFLSPDFMHTMEFTHPLYTSLTQSIQPTNADVYNVFMTPLTGGSTTNFTGYNETTITQGLNYTINPADTLLINNTAYTFEFIISSGSSLSGTMNLTLSNGTNYVKTDSGTSFTLSQSINTGNNSYVKGLFTIVSANETYVFTRVWSIDNYVAGDYSLWSFLKEWETQSNGGQMVKFIQIIIIMASLFGTFFVLYTLPGGDIIDSSTAGILGGIVVIWVFSLVGWLTLTGIDNAWLAKYTIALLMTLTGGLWIMWGFTSR